MIHQRRRKWWMVLLFLAGLTWTGILYSQRRVVQQHAITSSCVDHAQQQATAVCHTAIAEHTLHKEYKELIVQPQVGLESSPKKKQKHAYEYWNHSTQTLSPDYYSPTSCRHRQTKKTSLEILQDIIHNDNDNDDNNEPSCFRPNLQATRALVQAKRTITDSLLPTTTPIIINVGFPKSGSTSLRQFFACAGYHAQWEQQGGCMHRALELGCADPLKTCSSSNTTNTKGSVYMQMDRTRPPHDCFYPQVQFLDEIHAAHPHATFVLALRPINDWVESLRLWHGLADRLSRCQIPGLLLPTSTTNAAVGLSKRVLKQWACTHVRHVRHFVQEYPSHTLVEVDLTNASETSKLLGRLFEAPSSCWGHYNARKKLPSSNEIGLPAYQQQH